MWIRRLRACSHGGEISRTPKISHPTRQLCPGFTWKLSGLLPRGYSNGAIVYCACSHLASAISAMLASMCEYWSCALQSKLSRPPEISRCRAFTWIIVVPVNRVVQARYLAPPSYPGFMWTDKLSKQRNMCAPGYLGGPRYPCPPRYLASCQSNPLNTANWIKFDKTIKFDIPRRSNYATLGRLWFRARASPLNLPRSHAHSVFLLIFISRLYESRASPGTRDLALRDRDLGYPGWFFPIQTRLTGLARLPGLAN